MAPALFPLRVLLFLCLTRIGRTQNVGLIAPSPFTAGDSTLWPCGDIDYSSFEVTNLTQLSLADDTVTFTSYFNDAMVSMSAVLGLPMDTNTDDLSAYDFNTVVSFGTFTFYSATHFGSPFTFCFPLAPIGSWVTSGTQAVLQIIYTFESNAVYSCARVQYLDSVNSYVPGSCTNSSGMTASYVADRYLLANGSEAVAGSVGRTAWPFSFTSASTSAPTSSSGLSIAAKIGIGIIVPLVVLISGMLFFVYLRRRRAQKISTISHLSTAGNEIVSNKPELLGSPYDATIAGPVQPRAEIHGKLRPSATNSELLGSTAVNDHLPPELGHNPAAAEIGFAALAGGGGGAGAPSTTVADSNPGPGAPASVVGSIVRNSVSPTVAASEAEGLAEEADLLVQELVLIQMRKKALVGLAKGKGVEPEDLPGTRGEDYRDLLVREARIKGRIDEIDSARPGSAF